MTSIDPAIETALQLAIQRARAQQDGATELTGSVVALNTNGPGIHQVVIDGDTGSTPALVHSASSAFLQVGTRVALLFVKPHQVWIIGELNHVSSACRVWANTNTPFTALNTNVAVNFTQTSYDLCDDYDFTDDVFVVPQDGLYQVTHRCIVGNASTDDRFRTEVWELVANVRRSRGTDDEAGTAQSVTLQGSDTLLFQAGDRVQLQALQIAGGLLSVTGDVESQTYMCVRRV